MYLWPSNTFNYSAFVFLNASLQVKFIWMLTLNFPCVVAWHGHPIYLYNVTWAYQAPVSCPLHWCHCSAHWNVRWNRYTALTIELLNQKVSMLSKSAPTSPWCCKPWVLRIISWLFDFWLSCFFCLSIVRIKARDCGDYQTVSGFCVPASSWADHPG